MRRFLAEHVEDRRWAPPKVDALLAGGVFLATVICVYTSPLSAPSGFARPGDELGALVAAVMTVPLAWRRRWPLVTLLIAGIGSEVANLRNYATDPADFFTWFALGSAAFYTRRRTGVVLAFLATAYELYWWAYWDWPHVNASDVTWGVVVGVVPVVLGDLLRTQRAHVEAMSERERRVRELEAANAVESERLRIARELHDIVGHHLSAIGIHARATALLVHSHPDRATAELNRLGTLAATALSETRESVALLRSGSNGHATGPQPRLAEIDRLVSSARAEGIAIDVRRQGVARPLRDSVELCGYRLVQEALTNVIKHTPLPASAEVTIAYEPEALEVMISSHGAGPLPAACPDGQGLLGMRERVALAGGTLHAGPQDARTWVVRARLPIEDVQ